jgi:CBS domain containing-hemolysin-like protein
VTVLLLLLGVALLLANAVFVGAEFSLIAARQSRLQQLASAGDMLAAAAIRHARRLPRTLAALQIGISAASIALGFTLEAMVASIFEPLLGRLDLQRTVAIDAAIAAFALIIVSGLHTLFGEMVPKNFAIAAPERVARWLAVPTSLVVWLATPLVPFVWGSTSLVLKALRIEPPNEVEVARSADEIRTMLDASHAEGVIRDYDERLLNRILSFSQMRVEQVMVPWSQVVTAPQNATVAELEAAFAESGRGRLPLRAVEAQRIIGYVKSCDLALVPHGDRDRVVPRRLVRDAVHVEATARIVDTLEQMRKAGRHFAIVTGEGGGHVGIVTIRSVIELLITES